MAKAAYWTVTDVEARKRGEQTGLDTLVVPAAVVGLLMAALVRRNRRRKAQAEEETYHA